MMQEKTPEKPVKTNFFKNYNRLVGAAYLLIVLLTTVFFLTQLNRNFNDEIEVVRSHVNRHSQFIEFTLRSSVNQLEALRIFASEYYRNSEGKPAAPGYSPLFGKLRQTSTGFDLDNAPERDSAGNLTGIGNLKGRSQQFYQDIEMALGMNQVFLSIAFNLPNAAESGFISNENFSNRYPWIEASKRPFDASVYSMPIWKLGTPENNPDRLRYWAPVYYGGPQAGLLAQVAAPLYSADKVDGKESGVTFRGIVSIDTSLDYLNRINSDFGYKLGTVFLADEYNQVVAHPGLFSNEMEIKTTTSVKQIMPEGILAAGQKMKDLKSDIPQKIAGYIVIRHQFVSAPWQLIYVVPQKELWFALLAERGPLMLLVILGLTALMVVTYLVTSREFISPASKLVEHIALESNFTPAPIPPVPGAWQPWFETISQAFRESLQLIGIRQELDIAAKMQLSILPQHWPVHDRYSMWGLMRSAKEIGGDFYDYFPMKDGKIGIVVADVSGKGVPAALFGMVSKTLIRVIATRLEADLGNTMEEANNNLCEDNEACNFVTTFYAVYDPETGSLEYVNGGHPPPLLVHPDGSSEFLPMTGGSALGVIDGIPFAQKRITLKPGDYILMYSDGVTEAFNPENEEFTQGRLPPLFVDNYPATVHDAVKTVVSAVDLHANKAPQSDDITCVALRCH
jgi:sigma-B regulation protein RsbU (phosphoserine phosphatase)